MDQGVTRFLEALSSDRPTPGGGAAAGVVGAIGCSVGLMVLSFSEGKKSLADHAGVHASCRSSLVAARDRYTALQQEDESAYAVLNEAMRLPRESADRAGRVREAAVAASEVPASMMELSVGVMGVLGEMVGTTSKYLVSDLASASTMVWSSGRSAQWIASSNGPLLSVEARERLEGRLSSSLDRMESGFRGIQAGCAELL